MAYRFPNIENADQRIREICIKGIDEKYSGALKDIAVTRMKKELGYVSAQGSAAGYLCVINALNATGAAPNEFAIRGTAAASLLSYVIGLSDIEPLKADPKLYPEFYYGIHGDRLPTFEMTVSLELQHRLLQYFDNYPGADPVNRKYDSCNQLVGVYIGELEEEMIGEYRHINTFYINFAVIQDEEGFREKLLMDDVIAVCHPKKYSDYVKCFGFKH